MRGRDFVVFDIETVIDRAIAVEGDLVDAKTGEKKFPAPPLHKVVAIAVAEFRREPDGPMTFLDARAGGPATADERTLLSCFWRAMAEKEPTFVGFNSRSFDFPVLLYRSMRLGLEAPLYFREESKWESYRQRYAASWHLDLMDALCEFGASQRISLDLAARAVSAPGKLDVDGAAVEEMHAQDRIEDIRAYGVTDVLSTSLVWLAWLRLQGALTAAQLAAIHDGLLAWLDERSASAPHLARFAARWRELPRP